MYHCILDSVFVKKAATPTGTSITAEYSGIGLYVYNLTPGTTYYFKLRYTTPTYNSKWSRMFEFTTLPSKPLPCLSHSFPANVHKTIFKPDFTLLHVSPNAITVSVPKEIRFVEYITWNVYYKQGEMWSTSAWQLLKSGTAIHEDPIVAGVSGLTPNTFYTFKFSCTVADGAGPSSTFQVKTLPGMESVN